MRGEYKVPGGKLVAVDVEVKDSRIVHAAVSGDFFLEPDEALADINGAIVGLSASASADQISHAITGALSEGVSLIGFTPAAVRIAVRQALGHATGWSDHTFDVIAPVTLNPAMHVALDEVITKRWLLASAAHAAVLGLERSPRRDRQLSKLPQRDRPRGAARHGIGVVRRISRGRCDVHGTRQLHHLLPPRPHQPGWKGCRLSSPTRSSMTGS